MFRYTKYVMYLAPIGVGAAMAHTIGSNGLGVLLGLGKLVLTLYGALIDLHRRGAGRGAVDRPNSAAAVRPRRSRAVHHRVLHRDRARPRCPWRSKTWS